MLESLTLGRTTCLWCPVGDFLIRHNCWRMYLSIVSFQLEGKRKCWFPYSSILHNLQNMIFLICQSTQWEDGFILNCFWALWLNWWGQAMCLFSFKLLKDGSANEPFDDKSTNCVTNCSWLLWLNMCNVMEFMWFFS